MGSLTNGSFIRKFGPRPTEGDDIGILAIFEGDRLKVYIDVNGKSLGLAFNVPASTFKSIFPVVSFHTSGSATCIKQTEIPNTIDRVPRTFVGIEGDWKLINFEENGIISKLRIVPIAKIRMNLLFLFRLNYSLLVHATYGWWLRTNLSKENGVWKTSDTHSARLLCPEMMKLEQSVASLIGGVTVIEIETNGNLSIKSDTISSTWTRYDTALGPFVGEPFA